MTAWQPGLPSKMNTERYFLRSLGASDATETYISWWDDEEVQLGLGNPPRGWGRAEAEGHIAKFDNRTRFHLGIFPNQTSVPIGFIAIFLGQAGCAKTNIVIGNKEYWGEGVVLEVRGRVLKFLFDGLQMHKVFGEVDGRNFASIYNYKAQGFTCEGVLREKLLAPDGTRHDQLSFGLLREEWRESQVVNEPATKPS